MPADETHTAPSAEEQPIRALYRRMLDGWNARNGVAMAAPFAEDGVVIGFDGSQMEGRATIAAEVGRIFSDHATPTYVAIVRGVTFLGPEVAILRAVAGLVPKGQRDINPQLNAIQTVVAVQREGEWQLALYQNTPAQFHGRPDLAERLTVELRAALP